MYNTKPMHLTEIDEDGFAVYLKPSGDGQRDRRRGRNANLAGEPFSARENIDWQAGWEDAQQDRGLEEGAA